MGPALAVSSLSASSDPSARPNSDAPLLPNAIFGPRQRIGEAGVVERFEQVVERVHLEGTECVLIVGRDEHDHREAVRPDPLHGSERWFRAAAHRLPSSSPADRSMTSWREA